MKGHSRLTSCLFKGACDENELIHVCRVRLGEVSWVKVWSGEVRLGRVR